MKYRIIIALISLFAFLSEVEARNIIVLNKSRVGGLFGRYGSVYQTYLGHDGSTHYFDIDCSGKGTNRCRVKSSNLGGGSNDPMKTLLFNFSLSHINEMEDDIESKVSTGTLCGSISKNIAWDKNGDGNYDSLVNIKIDWTSLDTDFNDGASTITIIEDDYIF